MKKNVIALFLMVMLVLLSSRVSFGQDVAKKLGVGVRLAYLDLSNDEIDNTLFEWSENILFEGVLTYFFNQSFSLEIIGGYTSAELVTEVFNRFIEFGELKQIPILLNGRYTFWPHSEIGVSIGGGIGYYLNDFTPSDIAFNLRPDLAVNVEDTLGYFISGGAEFFLETEISMTWDLRYSWSKADLVRQEPGLDDEVLEIDLNEFVFGVGIKYYF